MYFVYRVYVLRPFYSFLSFPDIAHPNPMQFAMYWEGTFAGQVNQYARSFHDPLYLLHP